MRGLNNASKVALGSRERKTSDIIKNWDHLDVKNKWRIGRRRSIIDSVKLKMELDSKQPIKKYKLDPVSCFSLSFITYQREEKHPCIFLSEIKRQMLPFQWNGFWPSILIVALSLPKFCSQAVLSKKHFKQELESEFPTELTHSNV